MRRWIRKGMLFFVSLTLVFAGCGAPEEAKEPDNQAEGGKKTAQVLNIGSKIDFKNNEEPYTLVFDSLTDLSVKQEPIPFLAESWEVDETSTEFVFHLVEGVKFSDGSPLTGEDVKKSLERIGGALHIAYAEHLEQIEVLSDRQIRVKMKKPQLFFLSELAKIPIVKASAIDEEGRIKEYIGTGAYVLHDYEADVSAHLTKNPHYWRGDRDFAIEEIRWIVLADNEARKMALLSGQVDVIGISEHFPTLSFSDIAEFKKEDSLRYYEQEQKNYTYVKALALNWKDGPAADRELRRALEYAIDRKTLTETLFFGEAHPCGFIYNPAMVGGPVKEEEFSYDPEKAKEILKQAGYRMEGEKLVKDGKPVVLRYRDVDSPISSDLSIFLQNELAKLGIGLDIQLLEGKLVGEMLKSGEYDIGIGHNLFAPLNSSIAWNGTRKEHSEFGLGFGVSAEAEEAARRVLEAGNIEDFEQAAQDYWREQWEACPIIPLYYNNRIAFYNSKFEGFQYSGAILRIDLSKVRKIDE
ncbi:MAG: ABC transporter substrate-binding protein [Peptostreptococcaceae bacterium]|nr:ABC transporter substrate-binding protein [Peptostreptococcaceae bacterium]